MTVQIALSGEELGTIDALCIVSDDATLSRRRNLDRRFAVEPRNPLAASQLLFGTIRPNGELLLASGFLSSILTASGYRAGS